MPIEMMEKSKKKPSTNIGRKKPLLSILNLIINQCLEVFKMILEKEIEGISIEPIRGIKDVKQGIKEAESKKNIILRMADKRGRIVLLNKKDYGI